MLAQICTSSSLREVFDVMSHMVSCGFHPPISQRAGEWWSRVNPSSDETYGNQKRIVKSSREANRLSLTRYFRKSEISDFSLISPQLCWTSVSEASLVLQQHERKKLLCDQQHRFRGPHLVLQELTEIASSSLFYSISGAVEQKIDIAWD